MRFCALRDTLANSGDATASPIDLKGGFLLRPKKFLNDCSPSPGPVARLASSSFKSAGAEIIDSIVIPKLEFANRSVEHFVYFSKVVRLRLRVCPWARAEYRAALL